MKTLRVLPLLLLSVVMVRSAAAAEPDDKAGLAGGNIPAKNTIDPKPLEAILGRRAAQVKDGVAEFLFAPKTTTYATAVGEAIAWATFGGNLQAAVVDGDFAIPEDELQGVLQALRRANINIGELHDHMKQEEPRIVFLHFWAKGPAEDLARGLKSALDMQRRGTPPIRFFRKMHLLEKTAPWHDPTRFAPEVRGPAVRIVLEHQGDHASQWAAVESIGGRWAVGARTGYQWCEAVFTGREQPVASGRKSTKFHELPAVAGLLPFFDRTPSYSS